MEALAINMLSTGLRTFDKGPLQLLEACWLAQNTGAHQSDSTRYLQPTQFECVHCLHTNSIIEHRVEQTGLRSQEGPHVGYGMSYWLVHVGAIEVRTL